MATTRIMPLHVGKGRTESRAISDIIDYVVNPQKTDEYSGQQVHTIQLLGKWKIRHHGFVNPAKFSLITFNQFSCIFIGREHTHKF